MGELRVKLLVSFLAKVLLPVLAVMTLVVAVTVWVVNARITRQFEAEGARALATADAVFRNSQTIRTKNLLLRFRNLPNEPRYKAAFQTGDPPTLRVLLKDVLGEQGVDAVLYTSEEGSLVASAKRDPLIPVSAFEAGSLTAVRQAIQGEEKAGTIRVGERLYDVVSIPVSGVSGTVIGALTFGSEIGAAVAQEFSLLTHSQIALLASGRVTADTLPVSESRRPLTEMFGEFSSRASQQDPASPVKKTVLGGEHYFCSGGRFASLSGDDTLGYLLLTSYEQPLRALEQTQQTLLLAGLLVILGGAVVLSFIISKITEPLRELYTSAEAVGRGDFSRRIEVRTKDECGELARVFNQMTDNLQNSRAQLERTVETLKTTQAQLVQSEKLSGIGQFVAGVTHELNNPLTSVMGFSELLCSADVKPEHRRYLELIHKSAQRCRKIVQALLSFARRHQPERRSVCVNDLVEAAVEILQYQLRTSSIEIITQLDPNLPVAMVDPHQVQQAFLNIINNARQAIEAHQPKGSIRITTEPAGRNVRITIQDSGPGIPEENLSKIFDPFFTTKEVGKGTGLGLSLCYGIIQEHGGTITPRSRPGEGATFVIELPIAHNAAESIEEDPTHAQEAKPREGAGKRVLVIDDEEPIRQLMREVLTGSGYEVDVAPDGESGLRRAGEKNYDVMLCDWKMPGLNGQQVFERLRIKNPAQSERLIFITGDVVNEGTRRFLEEQQRFCLTKPFTLAEFHAALGKVASAG